MGRNTVELLYHHTVQDITHMKKSINREGERSSIPHMAQYLELLAACQIPLDGAFQNAFLKDYHSRHPLQEVIEQPPTVPTLIDIVPDSGWTRRTVTGRPIHRYDRLYHFRWTLHNLLGLHVGFELHPSDVGVVRCFLEPHLKDVLHSERIYMAVHATLRAYHMQKLYIRIPEIIRVLGGPSWNFGQRKTRDVLDAIEFRFQQLHAAFRRQGREMGRQRFPTLKFVAMALLHCEGIEPPYRIPWARTAHYSRQLSELMDVLCEAAQQAQFPPDLTPHRSFTPYALHALPQRALLGASGMVSSPATATLQDSPEIRTTRHHDEHVAGNRRRVLPPLHVDKDRSTG